MKITALMENTSTGGCLTEHGLSLWIEENGRCFLFDTGQSDQFARNADALGIDLSKAQAAVISHGHYDHGGGIETFLRRNDHAPVYLSRYAFEAYYNAAGKYIGLPHELQHNPRIRLTQAPVTLGPGVSIIPSETLKQTMEARPFGLTVMQNGRLTADDFRHEQYLLWETNKGRVLFSGCSHRGIFQIMDWFHPQVLVGGFHFFKIPPSSETLQEYARRLNDFPTRFYTCHCTGVEQFDQMLPLMERLFYLSAGDTIDITEEASS